MIHSHIRNDRGSLVPKRKQLREEPLLEVREEGDGSPKHPYKYPLRQLANSSGCYHCSTESCVCVWMRETLDACFSVMPTKREVERYHRRDLCAKSVLPEFVSRLVEQAKIQPGEIFYDLGCGNGSVLFQVAMMTGAHCVGIEINPRNARLAQEAWRHLKPTLERMSRRELHVDIICGDFCQALQGKEHLQNRCVVWAANLLLPAPVNHYLSERFRSVAPGTRLFTFVDLYPHSRSVALIRDPDAFHKFEMTDYRWQPGSVEWCSMDGPYYMYRRKDT